MKTTDMKSFKEIVKKIVILEANKKMSISDVLQKHNFVNKGSFTHHDSEGQSMKVYHRKDIEGKPHFVYHNFDDIKGNNWTSSHPKQYPDEEISWENIKDDLPPGKGTSAQDLDKHLSSIFNKYKN